MEWIYKKIWELKSKALTIENKARIQKLQQMLDKETTSENRDKINSANISIEKESKEEEDINNFLFNRYNR